MALRRRAQRLAPLLALSLCAHAEVPLPSYREALVQEAWYAANAQIDSACTQPVPGQQVCEPEPLNAAIKLVDNFERQLFADARLVYLRGLAQRGLEQDDAAEASFLRAVALNPHRQDAWNDLGELCLRQGRYSEAARAFAEVSQLVTTGPLAFLGPWREAEVAAHLHDAPAFEAHLREALRRGFSFRNIQGLPNWQAFYADPAIRPSIDKLITVYGEPSTLDSLKAP